MSARDGTDSRLIRWIRFGATALLAASLLWGAGSGLYLIWRSRGGDDFLPIVLPGVIGVLAGCVCLISAAVWARGRLVVLMAATIALTLTLAGAWLAFLWYVAPYGSRSADLWAEMLGTGTLALVGLVTTGQLLAPRTEPILSLARACAIALADGFALVMIILVWTRWWVPYDGLVASGSIVWGAAAFISVWAVAAAIQKSKRRVQRERESLPHDMRLRFTCPKCGAEQRLPTGLQRCTGCRFRLMIEIEEPRCECGYLLYQLAGDTCPECGRAIAEKNRWLISAAKG